MFCATNGGHTHIFPHIYIYNACCFAETCEAILISLFWSRIRSECSVFILAVFLTLDSFNTKIPFSVFTEKLLGWNKGLTTERDENGSTPLHFAAALLQPGRVLSQVFEANPAALYQSDHDGLFPIHVAASVGATANVAMFLKEYPSSAGLRDAKRRTFLHIAVMKCQHDIVRFACRTTSLAWILNMQDIDGNTALHLAVKAGNLQMFCSLFGNGAVHLNLTNDKGQTPLDISRYIIPPGIIYILVRSALLLFLSMAL